MLLLQQEAGSAFSYKACLLEAEAIGSQIDEKSEEAIQQDRARGIRRGPTPLLCAANCMARGDEKPVASNFAATIELLLKV